MVRKGPENFILWLVQNLRFEEFELDTCIKIS